MSQGPTRGPAQGPSPLRLRVEQASTPALSRLSRLPRVVPLLVMLALLVAGLLVSGPIGFALILAGVLFLVWILYLGWPVWSTSDRLMRLAIIAVCLALGIVQLFPHHR